MTKKSKSKSPAAKKPDPNVASNLPDLEATQENVKAWKKKRTRSRSQLTLLCKEIENTISQKGSRTSLITLLEQANKILQVSEDLNDKLTTDLQDDTEVNEQFAKQLEYTKKIADIKEMVEDYLEERKNDAASVAASKVHSAASVRSSQALSSHYEDEEEDDSALSEDVQKWREESKRAFQPEAAPDDWIDDYRFCRLKVKSTTDVGRKTTVKTTLSIYSGSALEWFSWIDLYKSLVHDSNSSSGEKLAILKSHLKGDCQDIVYGLGGGESAYKEALRRLKQDCGRRDVMRAAHLQALEKLDPGKGILTKRYAERIRTHLFDIERIGGANPADIIEKTCSKLSVHDRLAWNAGKGKGGEECRSLEEFGDWLCSRAAAYRSSYDIATNQQPPPKDGGRKPAHTNKASSTTEDGQTSRVPKCYKCQEEHRLDFCEAFKSLTIEEKLAFLTQHRLCFRCLRPFHTSRVCRSTKTCGVGDCRRRHHALLHEERPAAVNAHDHSCSSSTPNQKIVAMGVLKTNARSAEGNIVGANIFFDEGSDTTLVRQGFARRIGAKGIQQTLNLYGVAGSRSQVPSERITIHLETPAGEEVKIDAMSVRKVCDQTPMIWWSQLKTRWPHLNDLPLKDSGGAVDILLGLDHAHLLIPLELRKGEDEEPYAIRTRLGWIVRGTIIATLNKKTARMNFLTSKPEEGLPEKPFDVAFREFCDAEAYGTEFQQDKLHPEDQLAVDIVTNGTRQLEAGYEVALPWRNPRPDLPANRKLAEYRLNCLFRKFEREADYKADYQVTMKKYVDSGYRSAEFQKESSKMQISISSHITVSTRRDPVS